VTHERLHFGCYRTVTTAVHKGSYADFIVSHSAALPVHVPVTSLVSTSAAAAAHSGEGERRTDDDDDWCEKDIDSPEIRLVGGCELLLSQC
jgi:hypothetical protein